jgi:hypothetical protein
MRTVTMSDGVHGDLVSKLRKERMQAEQAIRLIGLNAANDWKGIPGADRRRQEERLPELKVQASHLTEWIDDLEAATTH